MASENFDGTISSNKICLLDNCLSKLYVCQSAASASSLTLPREREMVNQDVAEGGGNETSSSLKA